MMHLRNSLSMLKILKGKMNLIMIKIIIYIIIFKKKKILLYYIKHCVFTYEFINNNLIININKK